MLANTRDPNAAAPADDTAGKASVPAMDLKHTLFVRPSPEAAGPNASPASAQAVVTASSATGLTWQITITGTDAPLATPWSSGMSASVGQAIVYPNGNVGRVTASAGAAGTVAPTTKGTVTDGGLTAHVVGPFVNGLKFTNTDPAGGNTVYTAIGEAAIPTGTTGAMGDALLAQGSEVLNIANPSLVHAITSGSSVVLTCKGLC